ncbi:M10 family metallopeptidase C-terminal domain-containing protein [Azotobacter salinestris]|uniref:M10 family metallopeptidase C-terminal domain-containing protein n=1 Tax=Azotobacter salinestris TaxID=69964 RepID=UPI0032E0327C
MATEGNDLLYGTEVGEEITGGGGDDRLYGFGGNDVLDGGAGRDRLTGGLDADIFRFSLREDSHRSAAGTFSDQILDFDPTQDKIDVSALGFTGLGNGYAGTLAVSTSADGTRTYLKSYEVDAQGRSFEISLQGNHAAALSADNIIFGAAIPVDPNTQGQPVVGSDLGEELHGTLAGEEILGAGGDDRLFGYAGNDVLDGGAGRDKLTGGEGADTFRFGLREDSHRSATGTFSDQILDFDASQDKIDVSALGFTGLGNGYAGTLAVTTNADGSRTYLKSYEADAEGRTFEVSLDGNHAATLSAGNIVFGAALPVDPNVEGAPVVGTDLDDELHGTLGSEQILGGGGADRLYGYAGNDVLDGGAGRDKLSGGEGADTFRFALREDSHRSPTGTFSDQILDFDPNQDRIDVSALGFIGLGNGYAGTLVVSTNAAGTRTYLKSYEADAQGRTFEVALDGNHTATLSAANIVFAAPTPVDPSAEGTPIVGTDLDEDLHGTLVGEEISGAGGADRLYGYGGADVLDGGAGRDKLSGGEGADTFRFALREDSHRSAAGTFSDQILDFDPTQDKIDVSALGFTGLGNGYAGTLAVTTNADGSRTYLKSYEADAEGRTFEVSLQGNHAAALSADNVIFGAPLPVDPNVEGAPVVGTDLNDELHGTLGSEQILGGGGADRLYGYAGNDVLDGGAGRDKLSGGEGADTFRFGLREDSHRSAAGTFSDQILDFDASQDKIDVSALGFTGLGNGYAGTLAVTTNADGSRTYLKSYEADAEGRTFEVSLDGNHAATLSAGNIVFGAALPVDPNVEGAPVVGTDLDDELHGTLGSEQILGGGGADRLYGYAGNDVLDGGAGRDKLSGGEGADTFRFSLREDSHRSPMGTSSDQILDFDASQDRIDVSALGFTGLGNGYAGTLVVSTSADGSRTYLKSYDADAQGRTFEVALDGNHAATLSADNIVFAGDAPVATELEVIGTSSLPEDQIV